MNVRDFFATPSQDAVRLVVVMPAGYQQFMDTLSPVERQNVHSMQFTGDSGQIVYTYADTGALDTVYLGQGDNTLAITLAAAATILPAGQQYALEEGLSSQLVLLWALAQYKFTTYNEKPILLRKLCIPSANYQDVMLEIDMVFMIRDLINTPTNDMGPVRLAWCVETLAQQYHATYRQWVGSALLESNFPAIHAVGRAAKESPRLMMLEHGAKDHPKVVIIGKGVCFDSGGLDLKTASGMRLMKKDMGGAACAIGLAQWIMASSLPVRLQLLVPAVENAVSAESYRPGDVLRMRNGLRVEIDNTDAEGRLILADALSYACEHGADMIIDFATLTGAARVAVGTDIAAMFTPDHVLADALGQASDATGDVLWRLPLHAPYRALLDSKIADLSNASSSAYAGAITAALFLERFVSPEIPWVHFDLMAWNLNSSPGRPEGGEAMAVRAVAHFLQKRFAC